MASRRTPRARRPHPGQLAFDLSFDNPPADPEPPVETPVRDPRPVTDSAPTPDPPVVAPTSLPDAADPPPVQEEVPVVERLAGAMALLAADCDFAHKRDDRGFSAADAPLGHMYAQLGVELWTEQMVGYAYLLARRYRRQLGAAGIDVDTIAAPSAAAEILAEQAETRRRQQEELREAARTHVHNLRARQLIAEKSYVACEDIDEPVVLSFPYDRRLVAQAREIDGRRYEEFYGHHSKVNVYPFTSLGAVLEFAAEHNIGVTSEVLVLRDIADARAAAEAAAPDVTVREGRLVVRTDYNDPVNDALRVYNGDRSAWDRDLGRHMPPVHYDPAELTRVLTDAGLSFSEEARALLEDEQARQDVARAAASAVTADPVDIPGLAAGQALLPQQFPAVRYALTHRRVIIGDDMGWGKTLSSLATVAADGAWPAVVVCRPSLTLNWAGEIARFFPGARVHRAEGARPTPIPPGTDIVIIGSAVLGAVDKTRSTKKVKVFGWVEQLQQLEPRALIVDESQDAKERSANRTQACLALAAPVVARDGLVLDLSGTPLVNRPVELLTQLTMLGRIEEFGGPGRYLRRYCEGTHTGYGTVWDGAHNLLELHDRLHRWGIMVRRADPAALGLPPFRQHELVVPADQLDPQVVAAYRVAHRNAAERLAFLATTTAAELGVPVMDDQVRARLKFAAHHLAMIGELRQLAGEAKRPFVTAWVADQVAAGEKVMVAAHHRGEVDHYADQFGGLRIQGGQSTAAKERDKARFQNEPVTVAPVIAVSITAGGVGHTLTAAHRGIQAEWPWTPGDTAQMAKRLHRIGQHHPVDYYLTTAAGTVDEWIADLVRTKARTLDAVLDGQADQAAALDEAALTTEVGWRLIAEGLTAQTPPAADQDPTLLAAEVDSPAPADTATTAQQRAGVGETPPVTGDQPVGERPDPSRVGTADEPAGSEPETAPAPRRPRTRAEGIAAWREQQANQWVDRLREMSTLDPSSARFSRLAADGRESAGRRVDEWNAAVSRLKIRAARAGEPLTGRFTDLPATDPRIQALTALREAHLHEARALLAARDAQDNALLALDRIDGRDPAEIARTGAAAAAAGQQLRAAHRATGLVEQAVVGSPPLSAQLREDEAEMERISARLRAAAWAQVTAERAAEWDIGPDPAPTPVWHADRGPGGADGAALDLLGPAAYTTPRAGQPLDVETRARADAALDTAVRRLIAAEHDRDTARGSGDPQALDTAVHDANQVVRALTGRVRRTHTHPTDRTALQATAARLSLEHADARRRRAHAAAQAPGAGGEDQAAAARADQDYTATENQARPLLDPPPVDRPATAFGPMSDDEHHQHQQQLQTLTGPAFDTYAAHISSILEETARASWETYVAGIRHARTPISRTEHQQHVAEDRRLATALDTASDDRERSHARIRLAEHRDSVARRTGGLGSVHPAARRWREAVEATDAEREARRIGAPPPLPIDQPPPAPVAHPTPSPTRAAFPSVAPSPTTAPTRPGASPPAGPIPPTTPGRSRGR